MRNHRALMRRLAPILPLALLIAFAPGPARSAPPSASETSVGWIRPEDVPSRANALRRQLDADEPSSATQNAVEQIKENLDHLDLGLDIALDRANEALARSGSYLELADLQRQLTDITAPLEASENVLEVEAQRVGKALDDIAHAQQLWSATKNRPETATAEALVAGSVQRSIEGLDQAATNIRIWRARVLALSDRLNDRIAAVNAMNDRLHVALVDERSNLFVSRTPLWQSGFGAELRSELPRVPEQLLAFNSRIRAYAEYNPRPIVLQVLLTALLMFGFAWISARARERLGRNAEDSRLLARPYSVALLLALLATPFLSPLAPRGFVQVVVLLALPPAARIVMRTTDRLGLAAFAALFVLALLDRLALALTPLLAIAQATEMLLLAAAFGLAFWFKRDLHRKGDGPWPRRAVNLLMLSTALAFLADLGGLSDLATLLGRSSLASIFAALFISAVVVTLEPFIFYLLTSPTLRRSRIFERNTGLLRRQVKHGLRWSGGALWLYIELRATGLDNWAATALRAILNLGISVGAFSLTIGGVLAFVLTLLVARTLASLVDKILREDVYSRRSMQRGMADALSALVRYGIYAIGFLVALSAAGIQLSELSILLGGFGIGLGLGLQDLVKNFAAGLTLLGERRLNVGDALQIPNQDIFGRVRAIGMRATVVRNWNGSEVVVPNADLVSGAVTNWTLSDPLRRVEIPVGVAYGTDPDRVVALLLDVARSNARVLKDPPPQTLFKGFGDSSLDFVLRAWTDQDHEVVASDLALALNHLFVDAGIEIPFPQRDLHLASVAPEVLTTFSSLNGAKK